MFYPHIESIFVWTNQQQIMTVFKNDFCLLADTVSHVRACAHTKVQKVQLGQQLVLCSPPLLLRRQERLLRCDGARRNFWEKIFCLSFSRDLWLRVVCLVNVSVWTRVYNYQQQQQQQHVFFHTFEISLYHHQCFETKLSKPSVKTL